MVKGEAWGVGALRWAAALGWQREGSISRPPPAPSLVLRGPLGHLAGPLSSQGPETVPVHSILQLPPRSPRLRRLWHPRPQYPYTSASTHSLPHRFPKMTVWHQDAWPHGWLPGCPCRAVSVRVFSLQGLCHP